MAGVEEGSSMPSPKYKPCSITSDSPERGGLSGTSEHHPDGTAGSLDRTQIDKVLKKLHLHLLPKFFFLTVLCYVDRYAPDCPSSSEHLLSSVPPVTRYRHAFSCMLFWLCHL